MFKSQPEKLALPEFQYDVFLSHSSQDKDRVRVLAQRLKDAGLRVWYDEWVLRPGDDIYLAIERGLQAARVQVLCLSPAALGSEWVDLERATVLFRDPTNAGRRFIPLKLEDCDPPDTLRRYKYVDYREEAKTALSELLAACRVAGEIGLEVAQAKAPVPSSPDAPSLDHSPTCQAMWLAWSENDFEAWKMLLANGFIGSLERVVKRAHPQVELEKTPMGFYRLATRPEITAFKLLSHMRVALAGMQQSVPDALRQLTPRARDAVLALCQVLVERRINEVIPRPDRLAERLPSGLPLAVDTALNAYLIAAAWLGYDIHLEIKDGKIRAEGCLDQFPPNEYGFRDGVDQVRAKILSLDAAYQSYPPTQPGMPKPSVGDEYIRDILIPELKVKRVEVILTVEVDNGKHPLSTPEVRKHIHDTLGVVTACFGCTPESDKQLDTWANELQLMILNMHNYLNPAIPQEKRPGKAPGVADSVAFDKLLAAFLALARETPALQAQAETLKTLEAQAKEVKEAVAAPEPHKSNRLKAALDGMEMATKGLDNGAKLLEKLAPVKDWLLAYINSL